MVIDGAHENLLENNAATNSGTHDVELTTLTLRFGRVWLHFDVPLCKKYSWNPNKQGSVIFVTL